MIRSCYTTKMAFSPTSGPVPVYWFFAARDAKYLGTDTVFYSRNWEDASEKFDALGEQPGKRPWYVGQRPALATGQLRCDPDDFFQHGLPAGELLARPVLVGPVPLCCVDPEGAGGAGWSWPWVNAISSRGAGGGAGLGVAVWSPGVDWTAAGGGVGDGSSSWIPF
jgi:hypothetical protein